MLRFNRTLFLIVLSLSCFFSSSLKAEQSKIIGDYTVHYITVNSNFISPEIAQQYGIVRSPRNAFLNISILKNDDGSGTPVTAVVTGGKANFLSQSKDIEFIEVREGDSIYYLGQFDFSNAENLRFNLEVQPEQSGPTYPLSWTTQLYIN